MRRSGEICVWKILKFFYCHPLIPVTTLPLASVTDIIAWVTGFPFASVTTLPLESVTAITVSVIGFPLGSKVKHWFNYKSLTINIDLISNHKQ